MSAHIIFHCFHSLSRYIFILLFHWYLHFFFFFRHCIIIILKKGTKHLDWAYFRIAIEGEDKIVSEDTASCQVACWNCLGTFFSPSHNLFIYIFFCFPCKALLFVYFACRSTCVCSSSGAYLPPTRVATYGYVPTHWIFNEIRLVHKKSKYKILRGKNKKLRNCGIKCSGISTCVIPCGNPSYAFPERLTTTTIYNDDDNILEQYYVCVCAPDGLQTCLSKCINVGFVMSIIPQLIYSLAI